MIGIAEGDYRAWMASGLHRGSVRRSGWRRELWDTTVSVDVEGGALG